LYVVNTADLTNVSSNNRLVEYADDTYLVILASNVETRAAELDHVEQWAAVKRDNHENTGHHSDEHVVCR